MKGFSITAVAGEGNHIFRRGDKVVVIGLGPQQMEDLMNGEPAWVETPPGIPDVLLFYGRDTLACQQAIEEKLGMKVPHS
jgi:hypothetical protein